MTSRRTFAVALAFLGAVALGVGTAAAAHGGDHVVTDGDEVTLADGPNQTISGQTDLPAGSNVTVRLKSADPESPFLVPAEATVSEDGSFTTTVDLTNVEPPAEFDLSVRHDGRVLATANGTVVACDGNCEAPSVSTEAPNNGTRLVYDGDQPTLASGPNQTLRGETTLPAGTTLSVRLQSNAASHPFLRSSPATVTESGTFTATFDLADVPAGTDFQVIVHRQGETVLKTSGTVVSSPTDGSSSGSRPEFGFAQSVVSTSAGQRTTLTLGMGDADAATLAIGNADANLRVKATVRDGNDDGTVALLLDTTAIGTASRPTLVTSDDADSVTITTDRLASPPLDAADYDMALYRGTNATGQPTDIATLVVTESQVTDAATTPPDTTDESSTTDTLLGGGALAAGALLAIVGLALLLGLFRS